MLAACTHRHRPLTAWLVMIILRFSPHSRMVPAGRSPHRERYPAGGDDRRGQREFVNYGDTDAGRSQP